MRWRRTAASGLPGPVGQDRCRRWAPRWWPGCCSSACVAHFDGSMRSWRGGPRVPSRVWRPKSFRLVQAKQLCRGASRPRRLAPGAGDRGGRVRLPPGGPRVVSLESIAFPPTVRHLPRPARQHGGVVPRRPAQPGVPRRLDAGDTVLPQVRQALLRRRREGHHRPRQLRPGLGLADVSDHPAPGRRVRGGGGLPVHSGLAVGRLSGRVDLHRGDLFARLLVVDRQPDCGVQHDLPPRLPGRGPDPGGRRHRGCHRKRADGDARSGRPRTKRSSCRTPRS